MTAMTAAVSPPSLMACPTIRRTFQRSRLAEDFLAAAYDAVVEMDVKALTHAFDIAESESNSAKEGRAWSSSLHVAPVISRMAGRGAVSYVMKIEG